MGKSWRFKLSMVATMLALPVFWGHVCTAEDSGSAKQAPKYPVRVAEVFEQMVSDQIALVGTTQPVAESTIAVEVAGIVERFPVKEGDYVQKGALLVELKSTYLRLRLKAARAAKAKTQANLEYAQKELARTTKLKATNSVAEKAYDDAYANYQSQTQELLRNAAEIDQLAYDISQTLVKAPFAGFVSKEHTQVGQWLNAGGPVVTLIDLGKVLITVDVPERYAVKLSEEADVDILIPSITDNRLPGKFYALLPQGNPSARTFPVRVQLGNPDATIKSGMEAVVTFNLKGKRQALLVPKDAIVGFGDTRRVITVAEGRAKPVTVQVLGYYEHNVAIEGNLKPGEPVVIRGNERLRPGQEVIVQP